MRPGMQLQGRAVAYKIAVRDLKWRGEATITYAGGREEDYCC